MLAERLRSVRFRLALALGVAFAPVLALSVFQALANYEADARHRREDMIDGAERSAAFARSRLAAALVVLRAPGTVTSTAGCRDTLSDLHSDLGGAERLIIYNAAGEAQCAMGSAGPIPAVGAADWFKALKAGAPQVVIVAPFGPTRTPSLLAAAARTSARGFSGATVALLPLSELTPRTGDPMLPRGGEAALVDARGAELSAVDEAALPLTPPSALKSGQTFQSLDRRGEMRTYAAARVRPEGPMVLVSASTRGFFTWARLNPVALLILPLIAWALAMLAALLVTDRLVIRWLGYLERVAAIYGRGRLSVRPVQARTAPHEIRELALSLEEMAAAIEARDSSLRESLAQKDALMREIHHRVKNNLQVISSLLNIQQRALKDPAAQAAMIDTRRRVAALSLIYRALYQGPDVKRVDVRQFLHELIEQLLQSEDDDRCEVRAELEADSLVIDPDKLAPLALWAVEAIAQAQIRVRDSGGGVLRVRFIVGNESVLEIEDDSPIPTETSDEGGVGRTLMNAFARQLRGSVETLVSPMKGTLVRLNIPTHESRT